MVRKHTLKEENRQKTEEEAVPNCDLVAFRDVGGLMAAMVERLDLLYPEARRAIENCGASRCEGAYWQTMAMLNNRELRKLPIAWFRSTLKRGMEWTPEEIRLHLDAQRELELREMERSNDVTKKRWAKHEREQQAQAEKPAAADAAATTDRPDALQTIPSAGPSSSAHSG